VKLTPEQQRDIARRAQWYFDCYFGPPGESVVFTGDGVEDLDQLISRLQFNGTTNFFRNQKFFCDVGTQYSDWKPFDIDDVVAIKAFYEAYYGDVNKPNVYASGSNVAMPVAIDTEYGGSSPQISIE
jgi:hypothetical protein